MLCTPFVSKYVSNSSHGLGKSSGHRGQSHRLLQFVEMRHKCLPPQSHAELCTIDAYGQSMRIRLLLSDPSTLPPGGRVNGWVRGQQKVPEISVKFPAPLISSFFS